ncbi:unnamed protein product [Cladocopium goreaui]|uniref:Exocyst complex component Sec8 n=1 Tax=Cladocopium goreaui TaxID=2562237 RepID=A0A9P1GLQ6_9DINO|nr:unnamed protein product [Cladocopium goreaui]|mmetsp:Transcript_14117/g.31246  ORF Transcript_14117/g.31246 Transcript_14117/m.31246 type:complete len:191 (-) Transcript_14117:143-715(-)
MTMAAQDETADSQALVAALQDRLRKALAELDACRKHLDADQLAEQCLSSELKDHADVLEPVANFASGKSLDPTIPVLASSSAVPKVGDQALEHSLKEELSMAKALLMLSNVSLSMDLESSSAEEVSAPEVVRLKGNPRLIQLLITLRQKVALLKQQYLLLRGDMLYLKHEMNVCKNWVQQSVRTALQSQF